MKKEIAAAVQSRIEETAGPSNVTGHQLFRKFQKAWMKEVKKAIKAHKGTDFEYFGGTRPPVSWRLIKRDYHKKQFADDTESWSDFLSVNELDIDELFD